MTTKQEIIEEIKRTAKENDGRPLGISRFAKETGIKSYEWGKYWARIGDAQKEAGFEPNTPTPAYSDDFLNDKFISLIRKHGAFPTYGELRLEKTNNPEFPNSKKFFVSKEQKRKLADKIIKWCERKNGYDDIIKICKPLIEQFSKKEDFANPDISKKIGEVYLAKSGHYYKIGKSIDPMRRGKELKYQLPEKLDLIHLIVTDDPTGVENYWHKRFEQKRMNGEWFNLNNFDVKTFKRWRKIY